MLKNVRRLLVCVAFLSSLIVCKPANAQTREQLDQLSISEIEILFEHQRSNAETVINSCYQGAASYPSMKTACRIQQIQFENYLNQFRIYIEQRKALES
jgi:hypothetical protein